MDYIFPAVFYYDEEEDRYLVSFDDVRIYCQGKTLEEAFYVARKYLKEFCKLSIKMFGAVQEKARTYKESCEYHKDDIVLLVDAEVKSKPQPDMMEEIG